MLTIRILNIAFKGATICAVMLIRVVDPKLLQKLYDVKNRAKWISSSRIFSSNGDGWKIHFCKIKKSIYSAEFFHFLHQYFMNFFHLTTNKSFHPEKIHLLRLRKFAMRKFTIAKIEMIRFTFISHFSYFSMANYWNFGNSRIKTF